MSIGDMEQKYCKQFGEDFHNGKLMAIAPELV